MYRFLPILLYLTFNLVTETRAIIGGSAASGGELPFVVSLQINNKHTCGGSILDENFVITARSCVHGIREEHMTIIAGAVNIETRENASIHRITKIFEHPCGLYSAADVALVKVYPPFIFNQFRYRVLLPRPKFRVLADQRLCISGWGITKDDDGASKILNIANVYAVRECNPQFAGDFCTSRQNSNDLPQGVCIGDLGGPVIMDGNILVGVITSPDYTDSLSSNHKTCDSKNHLDRHLKVAYYLDWIHTIDGISVSHHYE